MHVTNTSEIQNQTEQLESAAPSKRSSRKSILALSVFAIGLNGTAAVYTLSPSDFALPNISSLADLLPQQEASAPMPDMVLANTLLPSFDIPLPNFSSSLAEQLPMPAASAPIPDPVLATLKDIQSAQQQHVASLQENSSSLQQNTALLQQDSNALASLRKSITDEQVDVKKISAQIRDEHFDVKKMSAQISTLIAKVDSLQNAITPEITSSIPKGRARNRLSGVVRKRLARQPKPLGPISVQGAPLTVPALTPTPEG
jgi:cell division protein FtsB